MPCVDIKETKKERCTSQAAWSDWPCEIHDNKFQGACCVVIESDGRMWRSGKFPKLAGVTRGDCSRNLTDACCHVCSEEALQGCLPTVTEAAMEKIHRQGIAEDLDLATGWQSSSRRQDSTVEGHPPRG